MKQARNKIAALGSAVALLLMCVAVNAEPGCSASAQAQRLSCEFDLRDDFFTTSASCLDETMPDDDCFAAAEGEFDEGLEECADIHEARLDLCEALEIKFYVAGIGLIVEVNPEKGGRVELVEFTTSD